MLDGAACSVCVEASIEPSNGREGEASSGTASAAGVEASNERSKAKANNDHEDKTSPGAVSGERTSSVERTQGDEDDDELEENEACRRVGEATVRALDDILEFRYSTPDHPMGEPSKIFTFGCSGSASNYGVQIRVQPKHFSLQCSSRLNIPSEHRLRVAEFVVRVNATVMLGHFDLDFNDGEFLFRIVHDVSASTLKPDRIVRFFAIALSMMDRHFPATMQMIYGGMTPEAAVRFCEREESSDNNGPPSCVETVEQ